MNTESTTSAASGDKSRRLDETQGEGAKSVLGLVTTVTQMNDETQPDTRKPSMFRVCFHWILSIAAAVTGAINVHLLMHDEFDRISVVASSLAFVGAGYELVMGLREYRKVVDARNQQGSELSPNHYYPHFAKEAELDSFLERRATLNPTATAPQEKPGASLSVAFEAGVQA